MKRHLPVEETSTEDKHIFKTVKVSSLRVKRRFGPNTNFGTETDSDRKPIRSKKQLLLISGNFERL